MTNSKPPLSVVGSSATGPEPPHKLDHQGMALWRDLMAEYDIQDRVGGRELLCQACAALDRAEALAAHIREDGEVVYFKGVPKAHPALREEVALRSFICRTLQRLGLNLEVVKSPGRPLSGGLGWCDNDYLPSGADGRHFLRSEVSRELT